MRADVFVGTIIGLVAELGIRQTLRDISVCFGDKDPVIAIIWGVGQRLGQGAIQPSLLHIFIPQRPVPIEGYRERYSFLSTLGKVENAAILCP